MKTLIRLISTLLVLGLPIAAQAECDSYMNSTHGLSLPTTITVPPDLPVGSVITEQPFSGVAAGRFMNCNSVTLIQVASRNYLHHQATTIYQTEAPGIGMRIRITDARPSSSFYAFDNSVGYLPSGSHPIFTNAEAIFYKIGPVTRGEVPAGRVYHYTMLTRIGQILGRFELKLDNSVTFVSPVATCDLATGDVNRTITLDPVQVSAFNSSPYAGARNFELTANCSDAANVTFRFSGQPSTDNNLLFANTGTADGVALWLYSRIDGTHRTIAANGSDNERTLVVTGNRAVLPLGAAYHKSGTVGQGTLTSTATVNITYN
ncbi:MULTISPECIES: fimbrial protein [Pseudomonas]|uniref:Fimbrial protein n=1 Tax=Pseudomonas paralactis TaxID=1615673 RepID=A0A0R3AS78_9PSED|nr:MULTISPECIES: fimbrial protein [Pseudomonas]KRP72254.1 fimbrial protein [Pseudomonas paralactis]MBJ2219887.1 fimbrial protein [Pseudomonas sp. MF7453]